MTPATASVSGVYEAEVRHRRATLAHEVRQQLRYAYLDLDELPGYVRGRRGWSTGPAPVWFRRRDYLDGSDRPLGPAVLDLVEDRTGRRPPGPVRILTQLRTMGWLFNPITAYYCLDADGATLDTVVLEVTNTPWHERHWYVLGADEVSGRGEPFPKAFHVSPFMPMDLTYRCRTSLPGERLSLRLELTRIDADGREQRVLDADLTGRRIDAAAPGIVRLARTATQTMRVSAGIYAHAARLLRRGAHFHRHPAAAPRRELTTTSRRHP